MFRITVTPHDPNTPGEEYVSEGTTLIGAIKAFVTYLESLDQDDFDVQAYIVDAMLALHETTRDLVIDAMPASTYQHYEMSGDGFDLRLEEVGIVIALANSRAAKLYDLAQSMNKDIAHKLGPRKENTAKRQREAASARCDGRQLQRTKDALIALARAHEAGNCPAILQDLKAKSQIMPMMRTEVRSQSYYEHIDTGEFSDMSPIAVALRQLVDNSASNEELAARAAQEKINATRELEAKVRNCKIDGFFPTPPSVSDLMFKCMNYDGNGVVLEPSAGAGHLADSIKARFPNSEVVCCEKHYTLVEILEAKGYPVFRGDFLAQQPQPVFDAVIMNPPFERLADVDHIRHAFKFLRPGGELMSVASTSFTFRKDRKAEEFRQWLGKYGEYGPLPEGAFNGNDAFRSTGVNTCLVGVVKPFT